MQAHTDLTQRILCTEQQLQHVTWLVTHGHTLQVGTCGGEVQTGREKEYNVEMERRRCLKLMFRRGGGGGGGLRIKRG